MEKVGLTWKGSVCKRDTRKSNIRKRSSDEEDGNNDEVEEVAYIQVMKEVKKMHELLCREDVYDFPTEIGKTLQSLSDSFDEMKRENEFMKEKIKEESEKLEIANRKIKRLEDKICDMEEKKRNENIILPNVPLEKDENMRELVINII